MTDIADDSKKPGGKTHPFRVLAGFGSIADELPTIEAAMTLARALEGEIAGCFVEDSDLLNLAALPFAKALRPADRSVQKIERDQMEREFARAASNWQRTLFARSSHTSVRCSFKIMRGTYTTEIAKEAVASDLVVINPVNLPHRPPNAISLLRQAIDAAMGTVIMPERSDRRADGPVVVLLSGSGADQSILLIAGRIAKAGSGKTVLLTTDSDADDRQNIRDVAIELMGSDANVRVVPVSDLQAIAVQLAELRPSFVVLQASNATLSDAAIATLLKSGQAPLILMRRG